MWINTMIIYLTMICALLSQAQGACDSPRLGQGCCKVNDDWHLYDEGEKICCGGQLGRRIRYIDCCSGETYYRNEKMCCSGKLYDQAPGGAHECCGTELINTGKQKCCFDHLDPGNSVIKKAHTPCNDETHDCGGRQYNPENEICCLGSDPVVIPKVAGEERVCCSGAPSGFVDQLSELCCYHSPHPRWDRDACCGETPFNSEKQGCVLGDTSRVYDLNTQKQCGEGVVQSYETCCAGKWLLKPGQVCCPHSGPHNLTENHPHGSHPECCENTTRQFVGIFNPITEFCTGRAVVSMSEMSELCGGERYDKTRQLCCLDTVINSTDPDDRCCLPGANVYQPGSQLCCDGQVFPHHHPSNHSCRGRTDVIKCYEDADFCPATCSPGDARYGTCTIKGRDVCYDKTQQICCGQGDHHSLGESRLGTQCCGQKNYNPNSKSCCGTTLVHLPGMECCGGDAYHPAEDLCTNKNRIIPRKHPIRREEEACPTQPPVRETEPAPKRTSNNALGKDTTKHSRCNSIGNNLNSTSAISNMSNMFSLLFCKLGQVTFR